MTHSTSVLHPKDIVTPEQLTALREAGWMVVRVDAIRLAQAHAREEVNHAPTS
jgi:hypothetical protein